MRAGLFVLLLLTIVGLTGCPGPNYAPYNNIEGARNAELVAEFGISAKQIQGIRMGCNREIANRRTRFADKSSEPADRHQHATATASIDEIVRYLRQQDDVVVSQEDGWYLVNGRFRMSVAELAARANRMRRRQQKSAFQIPTAALQFGASSAQKRHPLFWEAALPQRGRNGVPPTNR